MPANNAPGGITSSSAAALQEEFERALRTPPPQRPIIGLSVGNQAAFYQTAIFPRENVLEAASVTDTLADFLNGRYEGFMEINKAKILDHSVAELFDSNQRKTAREYKRLSQSMKKRRGEFGVEIEIEPNQRRLSVLPNKVPGWLTKSDGSLSPQGKEYVFKNPLSLALVGQNVKQLVKAISRSGVEAIEGHPHAGVHIHYNVQRMPLGQVFGLATIWTMIEPIVLHQCGPTRNGNSFCLPFYDSGDASRHIQRWFSPWLNEKKDNPRAPPDRGKYAALSFDSMWKYGSLEFRCFPSTLDPDKIKEWCTWIKTISTLAGKVPVEKLPAYIIAASAHPERLIREVFGTLPPNIRDAAPRLVFAAAEQAYDMAISLNRVMERAAGSKV